MTYLFEHRAGDNIADIISLNPSRSNFLCSCQQLRISGESQSFDDQMNCRRPSVGEVPLLSWVHKTGRNSIGKFVQCLRRLQQYIDRVMINQNRSKKTGKTWTIGFQMLEIKLIIALYWRVWSVLISAYFKIFIDPLSLVDVQVAVSHQRCQVWDVKFVDMGMCLQVIVVPNPICLVPVELTNGCFDFVEMALVNLGIFHITLKRTAQRSLISFKTHKDSTGGIK